PARRVRVARDALGPATGQLNAGWDLRPLANVDLQQEFELFLAKRLKDTGFTPADAAKYVQGLDLPQGMYVLATDPHSAAADAKIFPGDMITKIDGKPVASMVDVCSAMQSCGRGGDL